MPAASRAALNEPRASWGAFLTHIGPPHQVTTTPENTSPLNVKIARDSSTRSVRNTVRENGIHFLMAAAHAQRWFSTTAPAVVRVTRSHSQVY
ncbi:unnamed protein product [Danaus chrysippus]|uniref:(African queen) hypothetical protein n=1 Tax=Danaus chrysippus TaxID=151541 RepID=A0A8J2QFD4_9NEOP|nr:unnamed protein product [Danaus chrysippus]